MEADSRTQGGVERRRHAGPAAPAEGPAGAADAGLRRWSSPSLRRASRPRTRPRPAGRGCRDARALRSPQPRARRSTAALRGPARAACARCGSRSARSAGVVPAALDFAFDVAAAGTRRLEGSTGHQGGAGHGVLPGLRRHLGAARRPAAALSRLRRPPGTCAAGRELTVTSLLRRRGPADAARRALAARPGGPR